MRNYKVLVLTMLVLIMGRLALGDVIGPEVRDSGNSTYETNDATTTEPLVSLPIIEGFNNSTTPSGWTETVIAKTKADDPALSYVSSSSRPNCYTPDEGSHFVKFNSYDCANGDEIRLQSSPFSTSGMSAVDVEFAWYQSSDGAGYVTEGVTVQWSLDGVNWNSGDFYGRYNSTAGWNDKSYSLPAGALNQATVYVAFLFHSDYGFNCYLDDVKIAEPSPTITVTPETLSGFSYVIDHGPSAEKSFVVTGTILEGDITITPSTNYEISLATGGSFAVTNPIVLTQSGGNVAETTIYVRLKDGLTIAEYNDEVINLTSTNAETKTVICNGGVTSPENPAMEATAVSDSQIDLFWLKNDNNDNVLIVFDEDNTFTEPVDGTTYSVSASALGGTVIYSGSGEAFSHTELESFKTYYYKAWSLDGSVRYSSGEAFSGKTELGTITSFPWNEGFEGDVFPPEGWSIYVAGGVNDAWVDGDGIDAPYEGSHSAKHRYANVVTGCNDWFISPVMDLSAVTEPKLTYWEMVDYAAAVEEQNVMYSTDYTGSGDPATATWIDIYTAPYDVEDTYTEKGPYALPTASKVYLAFQYIGDDTSTWYLDNVSVDGVAVELPVVTADAQSLSNSTASAVFVQSNKLGAVYVVLDGEPQSTVADFEAAIVAGKAATTPITEVDTDVMVVVAGLAVGTYYAYAVDTEGNISLKGTNAITVVAGGSGIESVIPEVTELFQNYPNPFNPETEINFNIAKDSNVNISVFNYKGELVQELVNKFQPAGRYSVKWNGSNATSGIYFYKMSAGNYTKIMRAVMVK